MNVSFNDSKGNVVVGILEGSGKSVALLIHGLNSSKESSTCIELEKSLGEKDIATLRIDLFGHGESDGEEENITVTTGIRSILATIKFLKKNGFENIGILGSSYGGNCVGIVASQIKFTCVVLKCPLLNIKSRIGSYYTAKYIQDWKEKGFIIRGINENHKLNYSYYEDGLKNNVFDVANKIKTPIMSVHGTNDKTVPIEQSRELKKLLPSLELHEINGANHFFEKKEEFDEMISVITNFFVKYLK